MGLFRRSGKARHALGAAVTSIPSGPPPVSYPAPPVPALLPAVPAAVAPISAAVGPISAAEPVLAAPVPHVMDEIAELIASGEAWNVPGTVPAPGPAFGPPRVAAHAPPPIAPPVPAPVPPPPVAVPHLAVAAPLPRVQLGFRDGSSTALDPASRQSQALEELALSLTRRADA